MNGNVSRLIKYVEVKGHTDILVSSNNYLNCLTIEEILCMCYVINYRAIFNNILSQHLPFNKQFWICKLNFYPYTDVVPLHNF